MHAAAKILPLLLLPLLLILLLLLGASAGCSSCPASIGTASKGCGGCSAALVSAMPDIEDAPDKVFRYQPLFEQREGAGEFGGEDSVPFRRLTTDYVHEVAGPGGRTFLEVDSEGLALLTRQAMLDIAHLLRPAHLMQLSSILQDPESSPNDLIVAHDLMQNAIIAARGRLPMCQDTGTAICLAKRGQFVLTDGDDEAHISRGVHAAYTQHSLRYSQLAPLSMFEEVNTQNNLPAQVEVYATKGDVYKFLFIAKGGGSANKSFLYQMTKALLNEESLIKFCKDKLKTLGTSACPPYHVALVIGGLSAELTMKTVKLASAKYLDDLLVTGNDQGRAFRDLEWEAKIHTLCRETGIGAQFGGKYFCHDVRVIRLPRHGASCPVGLGVSCSADRQARGYISKDGIFLEHLETDPAKYMPADGGVGGGLGEEHVVHVDINRPMKEVLEQLTRHKVGTCLSLTGSLVVARDIAHAKLKERLDRGEGLPDYFKENLVYYAGPAKTPEGEVSGSFGPTTAGRMDSYIDLFMREGGSMVTLAKGNRSKQVTDACKRYGGFYLGSTGGPGALLAAKHIKKVEVLEYQELGMEAVWRIEVQDFKAFMIVDDKGNDVYAQFGM